MIEAIFHRKIHLNWLWLGPLALLIYSFFFHWFQDINDFDIYVHATSKLFNGQNIYEEPLLKGFRFLYAPFFAYILAPFANLPREIGQFFYTGISLLTLCRIIWILQQWLASLEPLTHLKWLWTLPFFIVLIYYGRVNITSGQVTFFVLWSILESVRLAQNGKSLAASAVLAFGIVLKLLPFFVILYWLYQRRIKAVLFTVGFGAIFFILPSLELGFKTNFFWVVDWIEIINPFQENHFGVYEKSTTEDWQGLDSILAFFFGELSTHTNFKVLGAVLKLLVLSGVFVLIKSNPEKERRLNILWDLSLITCIIPFVFPHMRDYEYCFLMPALLYLALRISTVNPVNRRIRLLVLIYLHAVLLVIGRDLVGDYLYEVLTEIRIYSWANFLMIGWFWYFSNSLKLSLESINSNEN